VSATVGVRTGRPPAAERPAGYTRERLLESATTVFATRGFESASLETIADGAGVTSATVYRHFRNKSDLLIAVVERAIEAVPISHRVTRRSGALSRADFADVVAAYVDPQLTTLRKLCVELHAVAGRHPDAASVWLHFNRRATRALVRQLDAAAAAGAIPPDLDTKSAANLLLVIIMGLCHLDTFDPDLVGSRRWTGYLKHTVEAVLSQPAAPARRRSSRPRGQPVSV